MVRPTPRIGCKGALMAVEINPASPTSSSTSTTRQRACRSGRGSADADHQAMRPEQVEPERLARPGSPALPPQPAARWLSTHRLLAGRRRRRRSARNAGIGSVAPGISTRSTASQEDRGTMGFCTSPSPPVCPARLPARRRSVTTQRADVHPRRSGRCRPPPSSERRWRTGDDHDRLAADFLDAFDEFEQTRIARWNHPWRRSSG
jgi:hypothetical protein